MRAVLSPLIQTLLSLPLEKVLLSWKRWCQPFCRPRGASVWVLEWVPQPIVPQVEGLGGRGWSRTWEEVAGHPGPERIKEGVETPQSGSLTPPQPTMGVRESRNPLSISALPHLQRVFLWKLRPWSSERIDPILLLSHLAAHGTLLLLLLLLKTQALGTGEVPSCILTFLPHYFTHNYQLFTGKTIRLSPLIEEVNYYKPGGERVTACWPHLPWIHSH